MPPRRRAAESLTSDDLATLAAAVADGRRATVYLREGTPSLGLAPGASARVLSISGTTLLLKPSGVNDELPYEADELRMTRQPPPPPERPARPRKAAPQKAAAQKPAQKPTAQQPATQKPATQKPAAQKPAAQKPASSGRSAARRTARPPTAVTVTLYGSSANEWSVAVARGGRKPPRARSVAPDAVEEALTRLGDDAALDAASSILDAARQEAQRRVEELSRELEAARQALAALDGDH
ncbi:DUF6319 family protein [Gordonia shandongensis]|uniref:DUF6319 family protein n=1 Tax=Gordonia shandongensis TaxID=376351 RepID=UPI000427DD0E|nr:hypothetical protein [Gordonia shandongensis]